MSAAPLTAQPACGSMRAVTGPSGAPRGQAAAGSAPGFASGPVAAEHSSGAPLSCSTTDCRRTPASGYAMCDRCIGDVLFGPLPERIQIARLSETDPIAQGIAAEISARSGR